MICRGCVRRNRASRLSTQGIQPDDIWDVSAAGLDVSFVCVSGHLLHSHVFSRFVNCPHMSLEASNQQAILAAVSPDWQVTLPLLHWSSLQADDRLPDSVKSTVSKCHK